MGVVRLGHYSLNACLQIMRSGVWRVLFESTQLFFVDGRMLTTQH